MKRLSVFLLLLAVMFMAGSAAMNDAMASEVHMKRVTLLVADLERSLEVYENILGFINPSEDVSAIAPSSPESYSYPVFNVPSAARIRSLALHSDTEPRHLALIEVSGVDLPVVHETIRTSTAVIQVRNFEAVEAMLRSTGLEIIEPVKAPLPDSDVVFKEMGFIDPDGHLVVIYQFDDGENEAEVHMKRHTLLVTDLQRSLEIYSDILGFTNPVDNVDDIRPSSPESYSYPVFNIPGDASIRSLALHSDTEPRHLALIEVSGVELPVIHTTLRMSTSVISVRDFETVEQQLRDSGLEIIEPVKQAIPDMGVVFKEMGFIDPDGHLIVIYQFDPITEE